MRPPVCCACHMEMRCQRNGVMVRYEGGVTYRAADRFKCPGCGARILTGISSGAQELPADPADLDLLEVIRHVD